MKKILAWIGIGLLLSMYIFLFVLALVGSDATRGMFMACVICTILIPIILYCFLMLSKKFSARKEMKKDFEELDRLMSGPDIPEAAEAEDSEIEAVETNERPE